jgi:hypothetical protein
VVVDVVTARALWCGGVHCGEHELCVCGKWC